MRAGRRTVSVVAGGVLAAVPASHASAQAVPEAQPSPYVAADPSGDVVAGGGDLIKIKVTHGATITLTARTRTAVDPFNSNAWKTAGTMLSWDLLLDPGTAREGHVDIVNNGSGVVTATVYKTAANVNFCSGTFSYFSGNGYSVSFASSCIMNDPDLRVRAKLAYDPPSGPLATDRAPNTGSTPIVSAAP